MGKYPDYPKRNKDISEEDFQEAMNAFFKDKGLKHNSDFSDDEKKAIIEECCVDLIGPTTLSKKYNTLVTVVSCFVRDAGLSVTPDDLSKYPDFPKKSANMTQEAYYIVIKKYWKNRKNKREAERKKEKKKKRKHRAIQEKKRVSHLAANY